MVKLQDELLDRQSKKDQAMRQRFQERTVRFMNAKLRTIGIDKDALDQQVKEKQDRLLEEKIESLNYVQYQNDVSNYLKERDLILCEMRKNIAQDIKETLLEQKQLPRNNAIRSGSPLNIDECTASSIQRFLGEDTEYQHRIKMQQSQLRIWCDHSMTLKRQLDHDECTRELGFALKALNDDAILCEKALENEELRRQLEISRQRENILLDRERMQRMAEEQCQNRVLEMKESQYVEHSPLFTEETNTSLDSNEDVLRGKIVRPDHFKGFSKEKLALIYNENASVVAEKESTRRTEKQNDEQFDRYLSLSTREQEIEFIKKQNALRHERRELASFLEKQSAEQKARYSEIRNSARFGETVESCVFLDKFGTSCR